MENPIEMDDDRGYPDSRKPPHVISQSGRIHLQTATGRCHQETQASHPQNRLGGSCLQLHLGISAGLPHPIHFVALDGRMVSISDIPQAQGTEYFDSHLQYIS